MPLTFNSACQAIPRVGMTDQKVLYAGWTAGGYSGGARASEKPYQDGSWRVCFSIPDFQHLDCDEICEKPVVIWVFKLRQSSMFDFAARQHPEQFLYTW